MDRPCEDSRRLRPDGARDFRVRCGEYGVWCRCLQMAVLRSDQTHSATQLLLADVLESESVQELAADFVWAILLGASMKDPPPPPSEQQQPDEQAAALAASLGLLFWRASESVCQAVVSSCHLPSSAKVSRWETMLRWLRYSAVSSVASSSSCSWAPGVTAGPCLGRLRKRRLGSSHSHADASMAGFKVVSPLLRCHAITALLKSRSAATITRWALGRSARGIPVAWVVPAFLLLGASC